MARRKRSTAEEGQEVTEPQEIDAPEATVAEEPAAEDQHVVTEPAEEVQTASAPAVDAPEATVDEPITFRERPRPVHHKAPYEKAHRGLLRKAREQGLPEEWHPLGHVEFVQTVGPFHDINGAATALQNGAPDELNCGDQVVRMAGVMKVRKEKPAAP